jgi:hypothetical protein
VDAAAGKLSDSTAKLLEEMAKKSGLPLKQINEVRTQLLALDRIDALIAA